VPPLRILYALNEESDSPLLMAVSAPKRLHRHAVSRNLLKRRIRESYRLQKPVLVEFMKTHELKCHLVVQYRDREILDYHSIDKSLKQALEKLMKQLKRELADDGSLPKSP